MSPGVPDRIGILQVLFFGERKKTGVPGEKPLGARERTNGKTQPTYGALAGNQTQAKLV